MFKTIIIFIDSQTAIKALAKNKFTSLPIECKKALDFLSDNIQVTLIRVPGHSGVEVNKKEVARIASDTPLLGPEPGIPVSFSTLFFHKRMENENTQE